VQDRGSPCFVVLVVTPREHRVVEPPGLISHPGVLVRNSHSLGD
jgi:hypothetical protein